MTDGVDVTSIETEETPLPLPPCGEVALPRCWTVPVSVAEYVSSHTQILGRNSCTVRLAGMGGSTW